MIQVLEDKFGGVIIDATTLSENITDAKIELQELIIVSTIQNKKLVWIQISIVQTQYIPILAEFGFEFHNCNNNNVMMVKKLHENAIIPTSKNYIVGVGAVILHNGKLLVIKDRFTEGYKLPGGHIEKDESIQTALIREVLEETGILVEFESIVSVGHFKQGQFGESNLYIVCTAKAVSTEISITDSIEIEEATWIDPILFLNSKEANNFNKSVVEASMSNKELKLKVQKVALRVSSGEVFF